MMNLKRHNMILKLMYQMTCNMKNLLMKKDVRKKHPQTETQLKNNLRKKKPKKRKQIQKLTHVKKT